MRTLNSSPFGKAGTSAPKNHCMLYSFLFLLFIFQPISTKTQEDDTSETFKEYSFDNQDELEAKTHPQISVQHYDCANPEDAYLFSNIDVDNCNAAEQEFTSVPATVVLYRKNYAALTSARSCKILSSYREFYCSRNSDSELMGPRTDRNGIYKAYPTSGATCKLIWDKWFDTITENPKATSFTYDIRNRHGNPYPFHIKTKAADNNGYRLLFSAEHPGNNVRLSNAGRHIGDDSEQLFDSGHICNKHGTITLFEFKTELEQLNMTYNPDTDQVLSKDNHILMCSLQEGYCDANTMDDTAYVWDKRDTCLLTHVDRFQVDMIKWKDRYFILKQRNNTLYDNSFFSDDASEFTFEVFPQTESICTQQIYTLHPTNFATLYVRIEDGGYNMNTGEAIGQPTAFSRNYQYATVPANTVNQERILNQPQEPETLLLTPREFENVPTEKIDYVLHAQLAREYIFFKSNQVLHNVERNLIKRLCEQDRLNILQTLAIARHDPKQAGYMLTGNHSKFLSVDHTNAWLYTCSLQLSPILATKNCYDMIPANYGHTPVMIDPLTRRTHPWDDAIGTKYCENHTSYVYTLKYRNTKTDYVDRQYALAPLPLPRSKLPILKPDMTKLITTLRGWSSDHVGIYTSNDLIRFFHKLTSQQRQGRVLQKFAKTLTEAYVERQQTTSFSYQTDVFHHGNMGSVYFDTMLSPAYFKKAFFREFGVFTYYFEKVGAYCGLIIAVQWFVKICTMFAQSQDLKNISNGSISLIAALSYSFFSIIPLSKIFATIDPTVNIDSNNPPHSDIYSSCAQSELYTPPCVPPVTEMRFQNIYPPLDTSASLQPNFKITPTKIPTFN